MTRDTPSCCAKSREPVHLVQASRVYTFEVDNAAHVKQAMVRRWTGFQGDALGLLGPNESVSSTSVRALTPNQTDHTFTCLLRMLLASVEE